MANYRDLIARRNFKADISVVIISNGSAGRTRTVTPEETRF